MGNYDLLGLGTMIYWVSLLLNNRLVGKFPDKLHRHEGDHTPERLTTLSLKLFALLIVDPVFHEMK